MSEHVHANEVFAQSGIRLCGDCRNPWPYLTRPAEPEPVPDLATWFRAQLDDDERVAREASRSDRGRTEAGEHWRWVEPEQDQVLDLDPVTDEYLNDGSRASLRSVEEYPTNMPYTLPHFVISSAEEVSTVCGMHITRWDPARVLAEVNAKRQVLDLVEQAHREHVGVTPYIRGQDRGYREAMADVLRELAVAYADRPGYREEWRP